MTLQSYTLIFALLVVVLAIALTVKDAVWECRTFRDRVRDDAEVDIGYARKGQARAEKKLLAYYNIEHFKPLMTFQIPQWSEDGDTCDDCPLTPCGLCGEEHQQAPCLEGGEYGLFSMPNKAQP